MCLSTRCANLITKENKANKQKKPCFMLYVTTINKRRVSGSKPKIMEKKHKGDEPQGSDRRKQKNKTVVLMFQLKYRLLNRKKKEQDDNRQ